MYLSESHGEASTPHGFLQERGFSKLRRNPTRRVLVGDKGPMNILILLILHLVDDEI